MKSSVGSEVTDMIHIGFNATKYLAKHYSTWSVETQDTYLRLDQDLAHLLQFLDEQLGLENVLVYLTRRKCPGRGSQLSG